LHFGPLKPEFWNFKFLEVNMHSRLVITASVLLLAVMLIACGQPSVPTTASSEQQSGQANAAPGTPPALKTRTEAAPRAATPAPKALVIPAGTVITVRASQELGSKISQAGDSFSGVLAEPVQVGGSVAIPKGAEVSGTVAEAVPQGRLKGEAKLQLKLESVTVNGKQYPIQTATFSEVQKGKGKRTVGMVAGGAGLGALIGGLTGGGKGAAIGAAAGGGAGTAGAALTGGKDVVIPAESAMSFKLTEPVEIR
jgi:hypothetical protein